MRSVYSVCLALVLTVMSAAESRAQLVKDGKPVTSSNIGSARGFTAQLWMTEHEEFFQKFSQGRDVRFDGTSDVRRDVPVFLTFFIAGPGLDTSGAADVTADIVIRKPDGSVYFEGKEAPCWSGKYPYSTESTQVADAKIKLRIEPEDPAGKYTVEATVHDKIKKVDLPLKKTFNVAK